MIGEAQAGRTGPHHPTLRSFSGAWKALTPLRVAPALLLAVVAACAVVGTIERPVVGGVYREAVVGQPLSLNPLLDPLDPIVRDVARLTFAGLVRVTDGGDVQGDLAEGWTTEDQGRTYTFRLREGALWHDGLPVTTADVVSTIGILQAPGYSGPKELASLWGRVQVEAVNPRTVRFHLDEPFAPFIEACAVPMLPAHLFRPEDAANLRNVASSYEAVGAGQFKILEQTPQQLRLGRHGGYRGTRPYFDEVDFVFFPDANRAMRALRDRQVDGFAGAPAGTFTSRGESERITSLQAPLWAEQITLFLNQRNPILADVRVRQAIAAGIDRVRLLAEVAGSEAVPAFGPIPRYSWAYSPIVESTPDLAAARSGLDAAGWIGGSFRAQGARPLRLQLVTSMDPRLIGLGEGIRGQLHSLGFQIDLQPTDELDLFRERLSVRRFDMALLAVGLGTVDPDPSAFWDASQATRGFNFASYERQEATSLLRTARLEGDPGRRRAALESFQELWVKDVPSVVVASPTVVYAIWDRIRGVRLGVVPEPGARLQHLAEWYVETERVLALFG